MTMHALTIDVEDWYHVENLRRAVPPGSWSGQPSRLEASMGVLLELLARREVVATFFVLGMAAERCPSVVRRIVEGGHELACHGWSHELIYRQTPALFREETRRAKTFLEQAGGVALKGYRASNFSVTSDSLWALDILAEEGFLYDSSIAPLRHDRYGIPSERRDPHRRALAGGASIVEFPISLLPVWGWKFPLGGGFFRLFPLRWTSRAFAKYESAGQPASLYLHPWELDPDQPRIRGLRPDVRFRHYARLGAFRGKLDGLLAQRAFTRMDRVLESLLA
ncbi:MAG: XrtA system polysaccharide deacetylase [Planctomycetaceae bacterium]